MLIIGWLSIPLVSITCIIKLFYLPFGSAWQIYGVLFDVFHVGEYAEKQI